MTDQTTNTTFDPNGSMPPQQAETPAPPKYSRPQLIARANAICAFAQQGHSYEEIGRAYNLTEIEVRAIINRRANDALARNFSGAFKTLSAAAKRAFHDARIYDLARVDELTRRMVLNTKFAGPSTWDEIEQWKDDNRGNIQRRKDK